jgi:hypothetical protein
MEKGLILFVAVPRPDIVQATGLLPDRRVCGVVCAAADACVLGLGRGGEGALLVLAGFAVHRTFFFTTPTHMHFLTTHDEYTKFEDVQDSKVRASTHVHT